MKALAIAPQPFFSPRGTPFSVYYRTLVTAELGIEVDLLTYGEGQDVEIPGVRIIRIPRFGFLGNVKVGPSLLKLFLDGFLILWTVALLVRHRYDFVHAHEESVFYCRFLKPIFRFKLVYDMHSSLPQQLTNFKFTTSGLLIGSFKWLEDSSLKASDAVITICPDLAEYAESILPDRDKHILIENSILDPVGVGTECTAGGSKGSEPAMDEETAALIEGKRLVVYAGTLEPYQGIEILLKAFSRVVERDLNAFLLVAGGTKEQVDYYREMARRLGIEMQCLFTGRVPQSLARQYSSKATVLVSPRSQGTNTPLKIYEQLASGIPLVATRIHSHTQVLDDSVAILVDPEPDDLAQGLLKALNGDGEAARVVANALRLYQQRYSRPVYVEKMHHLLQILDLNSGPTKRK